MIIASRSNAMIRSILKFIIDSNRRFFLMVLGTLASGLALAVLMALGDSYLLRDGVVAGVAWWGGYSRYGHRLSTGRYGRNSVGQVSFRVLRLRVAGVVGGATARLSCNRPG